jgi:hypothetical protein
LITPLLANDINSVISLRVPVYDPINLYSLVGILNLILLFAIEKAYNVTENRRRLSDKGE